MTPKFTVEKRPVEYWNTDRWCVCRDGEVIAHYDRLEDAMKGYLSLAKDGALTLPIVRQEKPAQVIYEGRTKSKLSILSQCREMENQEIPMPKPDEVRQALYPDRAA